MARLTTVVACVLLAGCRFGFSERTDPDAMVDPDAPLDAAASVRLRITGWGALTGPGGIACADDCAHPVDGPVTITAVAGEAQQFDHFDAPCGTQPTCVVEPGGTATATFVPAPITANRVFVMSIDAVFGASGRTGLDMQCATRATSGGLTGNFVAFVSTTTQDAVTRLAGSRGWVRLDGLPVLDQPTDLGMDTLPRGVVYDELRQPHLFRFIATGSDESGRLSAGNTCAEWTAGGQTLGGISDAAQNSLAGGTASGCGGNLIYCFELGKVVPVTTKPPVFPVGRYAFVASFDGVSGVAGADAACQTDATTVGLPGVYKAVLATTTEAAIDHTGPLDGVWRRPDGVLITRTGLAAGEYTAHLSISAAGIPQPTFPAFGAPSLTDKALATSSCNDWTTLVPGDQSTVIGGFRMSPFSGVYASSCLPRPVVCVQTQ